MRDIQDNQVIYRVKTSDFQAVLDFYEAIAWELFEGWAPDIDDAHNEWTDIEMERYLDILSNGRVQMQLYQWPDCPVCRAVDLANSFGRDPCGICPLGAECWRNPIGVYQVLVESIETCDPIVAFLALTDAYYVVEAARDRAVASGGYIEVQDAISDGEHNGSG